MNNATLIAHKDTRRVDEAVVRAQEPPAFTATWRPFSHDDVLSAVDRALDGAGLRSVRREFSLSGSGDKMFGALEVEGEAHGSRLAVGVRNSTNKALSVGICAGERVFVCDNLAFSSEFVAFRKHTGRLDVEELFFTARESLTVIRSHHETFAAWRRELDGQRLTLAEASTITVAAIRRGVLPPTAFNDFDELFIRNGCRYAATVGGFHGALTEIYTQRLSILAAHEKNTRLNDFIVNEVPLLTGANDVTADSFDFAQEIADRVSDAREKERRERAANDSDSVRRRVVLALRGRRAGRG